VSRVRDLEDATLCVIEQEDLAIAVRVISRWSFFRRDVAVGNENNKAAVGSHVADGSIKSRTRV
jgi:hypothetical protein